MKKLQAYLVCLALMPVACIQARHHAALSDLVLAVEKARFKGLLMPMMEE